MFSFPLPAPAPHLPATIARSRASECIGEMLGQGARMQVYPLVDEQTVLRVPRRTEQQLIDDHGSSGRKALATGHQVSTVTEQELHDLEAMEGYIGAFVPDTTPFADLDLEGHFRYYCIQRRVTIRQDLRICPERLTAAHSRYSLERFVRDVRDMLASLRLLPDLAGRGNLVLDARGYVKLVDINNFQTLISNEAIDEALPADLDEYALGRKDIRQVLPDGFVDDMGYPIADLTLGALHNLEVRGLGRDHRQVDKDPFYAPLQHERRRIALGLLRSDCA